MFSAEWLARREPADHNARSLRLTRDVAAAVADRGASVLDLACGTGSNLRYLSRELARPQHWLLVDHDQRLLELAARDDGLADDLATRCHDLNDLSEDLFTQRTIVTASALLDLVSDDWIHALATRCAAHRAIVLFALNYDGRIECQPAEPEDALVRDLTTRHQHLDKGFGPGLGPDAIAVAARTFAEAGYDVRRERSDWILDVAYAELQRELIIGWADAAIEMMTADETRLRDWQRRRLAHVDAGGSRIIVGHEDIAALAPA
jgi:hypothetical protein